MLGLPNLHSRGSANYSRAAATGRNRTPAGRAPGTLAPGTPRPRRTQGGSHASTILGSDRRPGPGHGRRADDGRPPRRRPRPSCSSTRRATIRRSPPSRPSRRRPASRSRSSTRATRSSSSGSRPRATAPRPTSSSPSTPAICGTPRAPATWRPIDSPRARHEHPRPPPRSAGPLGRAGRAGPHHHVQHDPREARRALHVRGARRSQVEGAALPSQLERTSTTSPCSPP